MPTRQPGGLGPPETDIREYRVHTDSIRARDRARMTITTVIGMLLFLGVPLAFAFIAFYVAL